MCVPLPGCGSLCLQSSSWLTPLGTPSRLGRYVLTTRLHGISTVPRLDFLGRVRLANPLPVRVPGCSPALAARPLVPFFPGGHPSFLTLESLSLWYCVPPCLVVMVLPPARRPGVRTLSAPWVGLLSNIAALQAYRSAPLARGPHPGRGKAHFTTLGLCPPTPLHTPWCFFAYSSILIVGNRAVAPPSLKTVGSVSPPSPIPAPCVSW